ncbi:MAG: hypothetical protein KA515_01575, partial [Candidatus Pacebacteria bacterium]|nr:hypothetical protein [Candidatus Paceibacterota bacterium]
MGKILAKYKIIPQLIVSLLIITTLTPSLVVFTIPKRVEAAITSVPFLGDAAMMIVLGTIATNTFDTAVNTTATAISTGSTAVHGWRDLALKILKEALIRTARILINKITQNTINWINVGYHGNPFYIENAESFFKDIIKFEIRNFVDVYAYNKLKYPFGKQFALNVIDSYQKKTEENVAYTLSSISNDQAFMDSYRNDFSVGGWNGFLINTQYPQNNYIGFNMMASEELARRLDGTVQNKAQQIQDTLQKSQGFLSPKLCMDTKKDASGKDVPTGYNNAKNEFQQPNWTSSKEYKAFDEAHPDKCDSGNVAADAICDKKWNDDHDAAQAAWSVTNTCKNLAVTTPGGVVGNQIKTALESKFHQAELAAALGNSFASVFDALLNSLMKKTGNGLKGLLNRKTEDVANALVPPGYPSGGGAPVDPGRSDTCTGDNKNCTCVKGNTAYSAYEAGVKNAEDKVYPNGLPAGVGARQAQTAVCGAYTGPGTCTPASQEDELIIKGLPAEYLPNVSVSIDFLIGGNPYT